LGTGRSITLGGTGLEVDLGAGFNQTGGSLSATNEYIGNAGTGTFTQSGGTHTVADTLTLAATSGSSGSYHLQNGSLWAGTVNLNEPATFTQSGGIFDFGAFNHSGGTGTFPDLFLGRTAGSSSSYNLSGGSLLAISEIIGHAGTGTFTQSGGTHKVGDTLTLGDASTGGGTYNLSNTGSLWALSESIGRYGTGTFTQSGGSHAIGSALCLGETSTGRGTYDLSGAGSLSTSREVIGLSGAGVFTQSGGTHTVATTLTLAANSGSSGTYNLSGGSLSAATIEINAGGDFNVSGGTPTVTGNVVNAGAVKTTGTNVTWNGAFTNTGVYTSDPATQTFSGDLTVRSSGYLVAASQDVFILKEDFINQSTRNTRWNTGAATLQFATGSDSDPTSHALYIPGTDRGPSPAGYTDNFAWGTLNIAGQTVHLFDGSGTDGGALYVGAISGVNLMGGIAQNIYGTTEVLNIYYNPLLKDNEYLHGLTYDFASGQGGLMPTPVPGSVLLLGTGLLGLGLLGRRRRNHRKPKPTRDKRSRT
jgi:hypothetical protein